jgi:hypothetical protein
MLVMMKAAGRSIDVFITATVRTQVHLLALFYASHNLWHIDTVQAMFQTLLECAAESGFDVQTIDVSGRPRLFRVDDGLVQQLKLCVRPEVLGS